MKDQRMSAENGNTERFVRVKSAQAWGLIFGLAALFAVIGYAAPYASLPRDLDRTQRQLDELVAAVDGMKKQFEVERMELQKLVANIDGKIGVLLRDSSFRNSRTSPPGNP